MMTAKQHSYNGFSPPPLVHGVTEELRLEGIFVGCLIQIPAQSRTSSKVRSVHSGLFPVKLWIPPGMAISQPPRAPCLLFDHSQCEYCKPPSPPPPIPAGIFLAVTCVCCLWSFPCAPLRRIWLCLLYRSMLRSWRWQLLLLPPSLFLFSLEEPSFPPLSYVPAPKPLWVLSSGLVPGCKGFFLMLGSPQNGHNTPGVVWQALNGEELISPWLPGHVLLMQCISKIAKIEKTLPGKQNADPLNFSPLPQ